MYPPDNKMATKVRLSRKATIDTLPNSTPIIRKYIIQKDDEFSLETNLLPSIRLYIGQSISLAPLTFLPWHLMAIFLNIVSEYNVTDNIVILPKYASATAKLFLECRLEGRKLGLEN